jgi:hypothetical protein
MEQIATPPEEVWQPVVCRLCAHHFELLITCPEDAQITLCQFCIILVEWFGLPEEVTLNVEPSPPPQPLLLDPPASEPEPVVKAPKKARQRAQLAGLLDEWGDLWRNSQEE